MLDYLKMDMEVSDTSMETTGTNNCRELLGDDKNTNSILAKIQERVRFFHKNKWNFIDLFAQSTDKLVVFKNQRAGRIK